MEDWGYWEQPAFWSRETGVTPAPGWGAGCASVPARGSFSG